MSVIAYRRYSDRIEIAADSILLVGNLVDKPESKLHIIKYGDNEIIIGRTGHVDFGLFILEYISNNEIESTEFIYLNIYFSNCIKEYLEIKLCSKIMNSEFFLFIKNEIFLLSIFEDSGETDIFSFLKQNNDFWAIGCANELALGAMAVGASPKEAIEKIIPLCSDIDFPVQEIIIPLTKKRL